MYHHYDKKVYKTDGGTLKKNYQYFLKLVIILEKLKREGDLEMGPKLLDKIIDAQKEDELTTDQVFELSERIQKWIENQHAFFASQEFQMKKLLKAIESGERRLKSSKAGLRK